MQSARTQSGRESASPEEVVERRKRPSKAVSSVRERGPAPTDLTRGAHGVSICREAHQSQGTRQQRPSAERVQLKTDRSGDVSAVEDNGDGGALRRA